MIERAHRRRFGWRHALLVALLALMPLTACNRRLGGASAAADETLMDRSEVAATALTPPASGPGSGGDGDGDGDGGGGDAVATPVGKPATLSHFGLLSPLFPGVGSQPVSAPCEPDDFYGGCL